MDTVSASKKKTPNKKIIGLVIFLIFAVVLACFWWWRYRQYVSTDDANLDSFRVNVAARVMAPVLTLHVCEGDTVEAGMLLAELDSADVKAQLGEVIAKRRQIMANLKLNKETLKTVVATVQLSEIALQQAELNYQRAKILFNNQAISEETYQDNQEACNSARVRVGLAKKQIDVAQAQVYASASAIAIADASIQSVRISLGYYRIIAPTAGVIARRWVAPGDLIQPGQTLFTINQGGDIWVAIYLEETKFENIKIGQRANFTLDAYPQLTFSGKIYYIGSNTASEFALIPPSNASGNYTKVAQRIPLKLSIEQVSDESGRSEMPKLVSGMSATVKIKKEN